MADGSRGGGGGAGGGKGKSYNQVKAQTKRINEKLKARGTSVETRKRIQNIGRRYQMNIINRNNANKNQRNAPLNRNQQFSRGVYTKGQMGASRSGNVGQYQDRSRTTQRKNNIYRSAINAGYAGGGRGTTYMSGGNRSVGRAGVLRGIRSRNRAQTNNPTQANRISQRMGHQSARIKSNAANARNASIKTHVRFQKQQRKKSRNRNRF